MKNKNKLQYVEEFRKLTAIQKLPTLKQGFGDLLFQNKADNNKFLRLKQEPDLSQLELNSRNQAFITNDFILKYCSDRQQQCKIQIQNQMNELNSQVKSFKDWSLVLNNQLKQGLWTYKFVTQKASPPLPLSKQSLNFDPIALQLMGQINNENRNGKKNQTENITQPTILNNKKKRYDFREITKNFGHSTFQNQQLQGNVDLVKKEIEQYRSFRTMKEIQTINQLAINYNKFEYDIKQPVQIVMQITTIQKSNQVDQSKVPKQVKTTQKISTNVQSRQYEFKQLFACQNKNFKYLSIVKSKQVLDINFFRDIGSPSRNIQQFIKNQFLDEISLIPQQQDNPFIRQQIDTHLLHYLQPPELKVDKQALNFNDILNISIGRVTSTNAHMCIRSQKVTRGQYDKLLRKMEKLYKMQNQDGKVHQSKGILTQQLVQQDNANHNENGQKSLTIHKLVEQINSIRKDYFIINGKQQNQIKILNTRTFNNQISRKLLSLLQEMYKKVIQQLPINYSILQIGFHIDQVNGLAEQYYDKKKLIWFIMTVLEEIQKGKSYQKNLTYLQNKNKKQDQPKIIKYRGDKLIARDKMGTKELYYMNAVADSTMRQKSISSSKYNNKYTPRKIPVKSPLKMQKITNTIDKSPLKTNNKSYIDKSPSTTNKKTAKKGVWM